MGRNAASLAAKEKERGGLVILSAQYGPASAFSARGVSDDEAVIDVTIPLQALVQNSKLYIPGGRNKFNLMGFWVSQRERSERCKRRFMCAERRPRKRAAMGSRALRGSTDGLVSSPKQTHRTKSRMIS